MRNIRSVIVATILSAAILISCKGKQSDAEIKASIDEKIAKNEGMKGLAATVNNGVVTLSGECPTEECRKDCADAVKGISGVKSVDNNIKVANVSTEPAAVEVSGDETLKSSVNDVVKKYNGVEAEVKDGVVTLRGEIKRDKLQDLIVSLNELKPRKVENELVIK